MFSDSTEFYGEVGWETTKLAELHNLLLKVNSLNHGFSLTLEELEERFNKKSLVTFIVGDSLTHIIRISTLQMIVKSLNSKIEKR